VISDRIVLLEIRAIAVLSRTFSPSPRPPSSWKNFKRSRPTRRHLRN